jgi:hypothetical protein
MAYSSTHVDAREEIPDFNAGFYAAHRVILSEARVGVIAC